MGFCMSRIIFTGSCSYSFFCICRFFCNYPVFPIMSKRIYLFCPCMGFIMNAGVCLLSLFSTGGFLSNYSAIPLMTKRIYIFCPCMRFIMNTGKCLHPFFSTGGFLSNYSAIPLMTEGRYNLMFPTQLLSAYRAVHYLIIGAILFAGSLNHIFPYRGSRSVSGCFNFSRI